jgi:hypothetical protein
MYVLRAAWLTVSDCGRARRARKITFHLGSWHDPIDQRETKCGNCRAAYASHASSVHVYMVAPYIASFRASRPIIRDNEWVSGWRRFTCWEEIVQNRNQTLNYKFKKYDARPI